MIIWTRWGFLVVLFALIGFAVGALLMQALAAPLHLDTYATDHIGIVLGGVLAAPQIYFFVKRLKAGNLAYSSMRPLGGV